MVNLIGIFNVFLSTFEAHGDPPSVIFLTFIGLLMICTLFGNSITLMAIKVDRAMHSVGYLFIGFKAVSDILLMIFVVPFAAVDDLLNYWPFDDRLCEIWMGVDVTLVTVQILILFALAIDRYIHMKYPTFYLSYITRKTVILINVCLWIVASSTFGIPWSQNYHRMGHKVDHLNRTLCEPQFPPAMSFSFAALTFVVPSVAMLIIYRKLHTYSKQTTEKFQLLFKTLQLNYPDLDPKIPFQSEQRATTTIGLTMTAFIVCWAPFFVTVMSKALFKNACCPRWLTLIVIWLGYSNCVVSPIIYASCNVTFRAAFLKLLGFIDEDTYQRKVSVELMPSSKRTSQDEEAKLSTGG